MRGLARAGDAGLAFFFRGQLTFAAVNGREHVVDQTLNELEALDTRRFGAFIARQVG